MKENFKNEYEKYSFIIREIIGKKLDDIIPVEEENGVSHYVLENGLHVYREDVDIYGTIVQSELHIRDREYEGVTDVDLCLLNIDKTIPDNIELTCGDTDSLVNAKIAITPDSTTEIFLPSSFGFGNEERDTIINEDSKDMREILEEKLKEKGLSIEARVAYTRAINLLDRVLELTRNEHEISETTREDVSEAERKEELIARIKKEQEEGKTLDEEINTIGNNDRTNEEI